ncbi:MAG: hypothetical protein ACI39U_08905 [Candidatus Cryptobacteroides sp.]
MLATSIILEASHGASILGIGFNFWVILHLVTVSVMTGLVFRHLSLNWGKISGWTKKFRGRASGAAKALTVLVGFLFILITVIHTVRHRKWFRKRQ